MKIKIINATSINSGGAMTVFKNFYENERFYYKTIIFTSDSLYKEIKNLGIKENVEVLKNSENINYRNKNYWNLIGCYISCKKYDIEEFYSFQNIIPFKINAKKISLYLHQAIPFFDQKHSLIKKDERVLWFYKNVYVHLINNSIKRCDNLVVQTEWLKEKILKKFPSKKIIVERPKLKNIPKINLKNKNDNKMYKLFYPASFLPYKNHLFLIEVMNYIVNERLIKNIELILTVNESSRMINNIKKFDLNNNITLSGHLDYEEIFNQYCHANIVLFPSSIESYGMPLIEAKELDKKIIANDLEIFKEVLHDYKNINFIKLDVTKWGNEIIDNINNKR